MAAAPAHFEGFDPKGLALLRALEKHNDRTWFAPRKERFDAEVMSPLRALVVDLSGALERAKIPIRGDAKRSVFRLYRDVRFSHDKRPYKTHASAYLSYDGNKATPGGIYIHVAPGASFASVAFYRIEPPMLARWRAAMAHDPRRFVRVIRALERGGLKIVGPEDDGDSLARMPRGYGAFVESDLAPYFRLRNFRTHRDVTDDELASSHLVTTLVRMARDAKPLLDYGWALD